MEQVYATEFRDCDVLINRTEVATTNNVYRQMVSARGSIRRRYEACVQAGDDTSNSCCKHV
jgi:hypothetical protein